MAKIKLLNDCNRYIRGKFISFSKGEVLEAEILPMTSSDSTFANIKVDKHTVSFVNYSDVKQFELLID